MQYVVRTFTMNIKKYSEEPNPRLHRHNVATIPCHNKTEAEEIAYALNNVQQLGKDTRVADAVVMLRDLNGKQCYFDRDYLEHVTSELATEPESNPLSKPAR